MVDYFRRLAAGKGTKFEIQAVPDEQRGHTEKKTTKKNLKAEQITSAKDLTYEEFEELSPKKKAGNTTTEENLRVDKWHHQDYLATDVLKKDILVAHIYGENPYESFLALVDVENR